VEEDVPETRDSKFRFAHHLIDTDLEGVYWGQTALADLDGDGRLEFIMGRWRGELLWYKYHTPDQWTRHLLHPEALSDVGLCVLDVDGDGHLDVVSGGGWYRNTQDPNSPFERFVYDPELDGSHDIMAADIDGDGRMEVVTMSDRNSLRWYRIPDDPTRPWEMHFVGPAVHAGATIGDVDSDGDLDIVRTNVWFENIDGDGSRWAVHNIGLSSPPPVDFQPYFAWDGTRSVVCDVNGDGKNDIVFTDAEIPGGKIWWMENLDGDGTEWKRHEVPNSDTRKRGAYHSLHVGDMDGDGDHDIMTCEMEGVPGDGPPRWYIWENLDGKGGSWQEHVILDANLGGHQALVGDVTGNGLPDIISKPWTASDRNALDGKMFVAFLENQSSL
jgi:hypothetical protein